MRVVDFCWYEVGIGSRVSVVHRYTASNRAVRRECRGKVQVEIQRFIFMYKSVRLSRRRDNTFTFTTSLNDSELTKGFAIVNLIDI